MSGKSKKKQRGTEEQRTTALDEEIAQPADSHAEEKPKAKGNNKKGTQQSAAANGALVTADREPSGRLPGFMAAALRNPDATAKWPVLLLRQGLLLVVEGIDARYGLGQERNESDALDTPRGGRPSR